MFFVELLHALCIHSLTFLTFWLLGVPWVLVGSHVVVPAGYVSVRRVSHADKKKK